MEHGAITKYYCAAWSDAEPSYCALDIAPDLFLETTVAEVVIRAFITSEPGANDELLAFITCGVMLFQPMPALK